MTNKNMLLALMGLLALPWTACDDIDEADRIIEGKTETIVVAPDTLTVERDGETFTYVDEHRLLIEDFTGWNCVNCPTIAEYLTTQITNNYPSVLVSLHMTTNSFSKRHKDGYNCESADSIADYINGSAIASQLPLPSVTIDQTATSDGTVLTSNTSELGKLALQRFTDCNVNKTAPQACIGINVKQTATGKYGISTYLKYNGACNLKLWLIEEGLKSSRQNSPNGYQKDYLNHGILRMVINGDYRGEEFSIEGEKVTRHNLNISEKLEGDQKWTPENCRVVAILTDPATRQVINCTEVELTR